MKNGKLVIVQRSLFPYSIERTVYTIWYKIYAYQNILSSKADTNQWFLYRLAMFFHSDNLSFLLNIYDPYNLNLWNNWANKLVGLAYQALRIWIVLPLLCHLVTPNDASRCQPLVSIYLPLSNLISMLSSVVISMCSLQKHHSSAQSQDLYFLPCNSARSIFITISISAIN